MLPREHREPRCKTLRLEREARRKVREYEAQLQRIEQQLAGMQQVNPYLGQFTRIGWPLAEPEKH